MSDIAGDIILTLCLSLIQLPHSSLIYPVRKMVAHSSVSYKPFKHPLAHNDS